jgi:hypothetical protein
MKTLDLELEVAPPQPRVKREKAQSWGAPRPVNHPEPTEAVLNHEMILVSNSVRCCNWAAAAYHAVRAANVYAELDPGVQHAIASAGYADAPSPLGDWSSGAWIAWAVTKAMDSRHLCDGGDWCPPDPPLSEYHARDYEFMRKVFCRG